MYVCVLRFFYDVFTSILLILQHLAPHLPAKGLPPRLRKEGILIPSLAHVVSFPHDVRPRATPLPLGDGGGGAEDSTHACGVRTQRGAGRGCLLKGRRHRVRPWPRRGRSPRGYLLLDSLEDRGDLAVGEGLG